jgi:hypothetical protein
MSLAFISEKSAVSSLKVMPAIDVNGSANVIVIFLSICTLSLQKEKSERASFLGGFGEIT